MLSLQNYSISIICERETVFYLCRILDLDKECFAMLFKKYLIDLILEERKSMTSRSRQLYKPNDITNLMANKDYSKITGKYLKITKVYQKSLGDFTDSDAQKEGFDDLQSFKDSWTKNIGVWNNDKVVWVHKFEVIMK